MAKAVYMAPLLELSQSNLFFTQMSWHHISPCDLMLIGDIVGNIHIYQFKAVSGM